MSFIVRLSPTAEADLERLFDLLLDRAETAEDLDQAQTAIDVVRATTLQQLEVTPFSFRKAGQNPAQRNSSSLSAAQATLRFTKSSAPQELLCSRCAINAKRTITDSTVWGSPGIGDRVMNTMDYKGFTARSEYDGEDEVRRMEA